MAVFLPRLSESENTLRLHLLACVSFPLIFLTACGIDTELVPGSSKTAIRDSTALAAIHRIALVRFDLSPFIGGQANDRTVAASTVRASYVGKLDAVSKSPEFSALTLSPDAVGTSAAYQAFLKEWATKQPAPPSVPGMEKLGAIPSPLTAGNAAEPPIAEVLRILGVDAVLKISATFDTKAEVNLNALLIRTSGALVGKTGILCGIIRVRINSGST